MFQGLTTGLDVAKHFNPPVGTGKPQPPAAKKWDAMPGADVQEPQGIPHDEADRIAYQAGVTALAPLIRRVEALEKDIAELKAAQTLPHMRNVEKRKS